MHQPDNEKQAHLSLDAELERQIETYARANGVTPAEVVREAFAHFAMGRNGQQAVANENAKGDEFAEPWEIACSVSATVPYSEWEKLPSDLSKNVDHYLYGAPRKED